MLFGPIHSAICILQALRNANARCLICLKQRTLFKGIVADKDSCCRLACLVVRSMFIAPLHIEVVLSGRWIPGCLGTLLNGKMTAWEPFRKSDDLTKGFFWVASQTQKMALGPFIRPSRVPQTCRALEPWIVACKWFLGVPQCIFCVSQNAKFALGALFCSFFGLLGRNVYLQVVSSA